MLAKSGKLPRRGAWSYEVKWDGFRAIVSTEGPLRVRSRRGWNMTEHVRFLEQLPVRAVLDGELVAFGDDGKPDFERVCERMLFRHDEIPLLFIVFDVLSVEGEDVRAQPYRQRRRILEQLRLDGAQWRVPEAFEDGEALWEAVCEHELEGVVAKRLNDPYRCRERSWVKVKNRRYWRYELEREGAFQSRKRTLAISN
jgi:bifunctional non-homologous end joining protein LigD